MKKTILITGANGQLGTDLVHLVDSSSYEVVAFTKQGLDITDYSVVDETIQRIKPDWILHAAAYTNVEAAEDEGKEMNWLVNATGTENVAKAAKQAGAKMIYVSTDYVFDGTKTTEYEVTDQVNPLNEYGKAKLAGEQAVQNILSKDGYVIRTSWVFGVHGNNFVYTMMKLAETRSELNVVADQFGRPTFSEDLAQFMLYLVGDSKIPGGVYHFSNDESCSWYEFATEILADSTTTVNPCNSDEFPQKAERPVKSILSLSSLKDTDFTVETWNDALNRFKNIVKTTQRN